MISRRFSVSVSIHIGLKSEAKWYLSKFSWGHAFIELNNELLERYSACTSSKEILQVQDTYLQEAQVERQNRREQYDLPLSSDSSDSDADDDTQEKTDGDSSAIAPNGKQQ